MMAETDGAVPHQQHDGTNAAARLAATEETIDVDGVKRTEAKLNQDEQELRRIIDLIPQTIVVLNPDGKAIFANRGALEYTGLTLDEVRKVFEVLASLGTIEFTNSQLRELVGERSTSLICTCLWRPCRSVALGTLALGIITGNTVSIP